MSEADNLCMVERTKSRRERNGNCQKIPGSHPQPLQEQNCHDDSYQESEVEKRHQAKVIQISLENYVS